MNFGLWLFSLLLVLQKARANLIAEAIMNDAIKEVFVAHGHTMGRSLVDPPASNMKPVKWNEALAKGAQAYANTCPQKKGPNNNRHSSAESRKNIAGFASVGENYDVQGATMDRTSAQHLAEDEPSVISNAKHAMREWWLEHKKYNYGTNKCSGGQCGHYTQMVWADTTDIGCGMAMCGDIIDGWHGWFTLCRYGPAGNVNWARPYEAGEKSEKPVEPKPAKPPPPEAAKPMVPKPVQPAPPKPVQPMVPKPVQPAPPKPVQPMVPKPVQPAPPKPVQPMVPKPVQPEAPVIQALPPPTDKGPAEAIGKDRSLSPPIDGEDVEEACCFWAKVGFCDTNPYWMRPNCQKSCGTPACRVDNAQDCAVTVNLEGCPWIDSPTDDVPKEEGPTHPVGLSKPGCDNKHKHCSFWASMGECVSSKTWMGANCSAACGCGGPVNGGNGAPSGGNGNGNEYRTQ